MLSQMLANNPQAQQVLNDPQMLPQHNKTMQRMGGNNSGNNGRTMNDTLFIAIDIPSINTFYCRSNPSI